ncbi:hypothetical protein CRM22_004776 [Opisthorchis felineus]|uniref:Uncharacterized protein n=1 Tax=Opisthorchis felineus TaxID=147828 RepID=A0A4S2LUH1_OPIFE|nr:hypothetical protein CRM22_004776 [Opisthorchis felineus]
MSEILEELAAHGFEIVKDESGDTLVKLVFMDENDEATGYALVSPEDAKRILSGQATLQNVLDDEGKQVLTLTAVEGEDQPNQQESVAPQPEPGGPDDEPPVGISDQTDSLTVSEAQPTTQSNPLPTGNGTMEVLEPNSTEAVPVPVDKENTAHAAQGDNAVEQYILSEQTAIVDNKPTQLVTLIDAQGQVLDQKHGEAGEQVVLEMHGQMFSYELQGPSENGEPITSTLLVSSGDTDAEASEGTATQLSERDTSSATASANWVEQPATSSEADETGDATPVGQQFTLTEAVAMVDGEALQTVILTDENGNVLDQKQGRTGEHVIIEMSGNSLEYVFLGPTENGEPITTTLVVTTDPDVAEHAEASGAELSEAVTTVSNWCPAGLPPEFYSILCRQVESIVATRIPQTEDGTAFYQPEPYHRKLGSLPTYHQMTNLAENYQIGANHGETLERYEELRNFARIYRPSGPQSRALTKYEIAMNEAAAQLCRYQPGLLFHKRELFHLAKETVEHSQTILNSERRLIHQGQETATQLQHLALQSQAQVVKSVPPTSAARPQPPRALQSATTTAAATPQPPQPSPATAAVGGRVASSQLALLESRGLSGIKPQTVGMSSTGIPTFSAPIAGDASVEPGATVPPQSMTETAITGSAGKPRTSLGDNGMNYYPSMPLMKRDTICKLTTAQDEAIRASALDVILDLPRYDLKSRIDCTNIELACWEQAKQLAAQTNLPIDSTTSENAAGLHAAISALLTNEKRVNSVRDSAALYGRPPGVPQINAASLSRSSTISALIPYEVACNEAAAYLTAAVPQLLTHRRELSELAKKVVRNSGCLFTNSSAVDKLAVGGGVYRFYCSDQLPELDLSAADQLLTDPLDRSDSPDSGCCLNGGDAESENVIASFQTLALSCEECNNVIDDVTIYTSTGTDSLKKVRILNLSDCGFTGMIPMHLNQCPNLIELNLSGNALSAFPRCLHLPKLKRLNLRNNPRLQNPNPSTGLVEPPLVEQFPRLVSVELDPPLVKVLSRQALACLCPYLKTVNGEEFTEEPTEETIKAIQTVKHQLSTLIYSKWEDDIAGFYKKGLPKRDTIRVIETLVLHAVKRSVDVGNPFAHCKSILARRVAEDFLSPKMLDDDVEDEATERLQRINEMSDEEEIRDSDSEVDVDEQEPARGATLEENNGLENENMALDERDSSSSLVKTKVIPSRRSKKVNSEFTEASVAQREAEAAAANLTLLPDEPPDRLINVVGQALRHGKTVVYAVIRTAARQPDGELIPVGGGLGITSSTMPPVTSTFPTLSSVPEPTPELSSTVIQTQYEDEMFSEEPSPVAASIEEAPVAQPTSIPRHKPAPKSVKLAAQRKQALARKKTQPKTDSSQQSPPIATQDTSLHTRRPGLLTRPTAEAKKPGRNIPKILPRTPTKPLPKPPPPPKPPVVKTPVSKPGAQKTSKTPTNRAKPSVTKPLLPTAAVSSVGPVYTVQQRRLLPSDYIIRPSQSESQPAYVVPNILAQTKLAGVSAVPTVPVSPVPVSAFSTPSDVSTAAPAHPATAPVVPTHAHTAPVRAAAVPACAPVPARAPTTPSAPPAAATPKRSPVSTPRRGRPPGAQSVAKKQAAAEIAAKETSFLLENVRIPPPHAPPPSTMRMSTRDTNRLKRFSVYGVIDTAAALAGDEEALIAAALAVEEEQEANAAREILESAVVLSEQDTAIAEAAVAKVKENASVVVIGADTGGWIVADKPSPDKQQTPTQVEVPDDTRKRRRRTVPTPSREDVEDADFNPYSPAAGRKRASKVLSPRPSSEPKRAAIASFTHAPPERAPQEPRKDIKSLTQLGSVVDYDPLHFIRCHARDNDPLDCDTKVWRCAFEPSVDDPTNETSNVVATCGGECVCLIDCRSGRVMKRFKHLGEEFYSLAWTTVEMAAGHKTNLLAAAGKLREIRLLHPEQLVCYAEMRGHKDDIACMIFHPEKPTILFSGDSKASVLVWDIGIPSAPEYRTRHQLLMRLACPRRNLNPVLNLIFLPKFDALLAGCEDGVFMWSLSEFRREKHNEEKEPDLELKIPTRREPCFDGLAKLTENLVVVKCVEEGEIYVFDYNQVVQKVKRLTSSKKVVNVEIRGQLRWQTTEEIYINVTARSNLHTVVCGDNEGTIWLYDLQKQVEEDARRFKTKPIKILEWPECSIGGAKEEDTQIKESITSGFKNPVVNATDISHDGQYLAAVTDNNLVCIWKFSG